MLIKRLKLFTKLENLQGLSETLLRDIIKILVMGDKCPGDIDHWLGLSTDSCYTNISNIQEIKKESCIFFGFFSEDEIKKERLTNVLNDFKKYCSNPEDYFRYLWKEIWDQRDKDAPKYHSLMKTFTPSSSDIENYLGQLWYIFCNFTGQADENTEPWKISYKNTKLKFGKGKFTSPEKFKERLMKIIFTLRPDIEFAYLSHNQK